MNNISDIIEGFITEMLGQENSLNLSRNELAQYFNCAPSQINYVLSTRFSVQRGFLIESKRGGGGYIKLVKLVPADDYFIKIINSQIGQEIDFNSAVQILDNLLDNEFLSEYEHRLIKSAISNRALNSPLKNDNYVRANILKNVVYEIQRIKD
jgi:transcriptional regulator CtsR